MDKKALLLYWSPKTAIDISKRETKIDHAASDQFSRVAAGDTLWIITVYDGELYLLNKLVVEEITNQLGAMKRLGAANVWGEKKYYALPHQNQIEPLKEISITSIADKLRFVSVSEGGEKLTLTDKGKVNAQQLQTMRVLEEVSVIILEQAWQGDTP